MNNKPRKNHIDTLSALLLFLIFAVCILSVLLAGAGVYKRLTVRDSDAYRQRTCTQYIATKVRQCPSPDAISVTDFGDGDCLIFTEKIDGQEYMSMIYCYGGYLRELFADPLYIPSPEAGEKVIEASGLFISNADGLLHIYLSAGDGKYVQLDISVRGGEEALE